MKPKIGDKFDYKDLMKRFPGYTFTKEQDSSMAINKVVVSNSKEVFVFDTHGPNSDVFSYAGSYPAKERKDFKQEYPTTTPESYGIDKLSKWTKEAAETTRKRDEERDILERVYGGMGWDKPSPTYNKFFDTGRCSGKSATMTIYDEWAKGNVFYRDGIWQDKKKEKKVTKKYYVVNGKQIKMVVPERWNENNGAYVGPYSKGFVDALGQDDCCNTTMDYNTELECEAYMAGWNDGMEASVD